MHLLKVALISAIPPRRQYGLASGEDSEASYLDFPIKTALILDTKDQCKVISATHYVYSNYTIWNQDNYHHVGLWTQWIQLWAQILYITWPLMPLILIGNQYQLRLCVQHSLNCLGIPLSPMYSYLNKLPLCEAM